MEKIIILLSILTLIATDTFAQKKVSGTVFDEWNEPMIGAAIIEGGTTNGTFTDIDGWFEFFTTKDTCEINISFIGCYNETIKIMSDTVTKITLKLDSAVFSDNRRFTRQAIGLNYDIANSLFGVSYENTSFKYVLNYVIPKFMYGISAQSNFKKDYGFDGSFGIMNPIKNINSISVNYARKNYSEQADFKFDKISIEGTTYFWHSGLWLYVEPTFQWLNDKNNFGLIVGLGRNFWQQRFYIDLSAGYFNEYWTYSIGAQGWLYNPLLKWRLSYEKIDQFDFFNVGLIFKF